MNPNDDQMPGVVRALTTEELAEDAFLKSENVRALEMMNTPSDFEDRKRAFVQLALAREAANNAHLALSERIDRK